MQRHEHLLLALLAATISHRTDRCQVLLPASAECWKSLADLAATHGVTGLIFSAIEHLPNACLPPRDILLKMFGGTERQKERYRHQFATASKFAEALSAKGVEMKVLKGISFSTYYDQPELRECGDCDCYLTRLSNGNTAGSGMPNSTGYDVGNETIKELGGRAEAGTYKHSHLFLDHVMFENHQYITDFNGTKRGKQTELLLEKTISAEPGAAIRQTAMVRPCAHFNALHLVRHAQGNFILSGLVLRMLYDWAVFLRAEQAHLDWERLYADLETCRLRRFAEVMTSICVQYFDVHLTLSSGIALCHDDRLVARVLRDTLSDRMRLKQNEGLVHKTARILARFYRMFAYRQLTIEPVHTMIWNAFAFSSYAKRKAPSLE